jgi:hypothetical protein
VKSLIEHALLLSTMMTKERRFEKPLSSAF